MNKKTARLNLINMIKKILILVISASFLIVGYVILVKPNNTSGEIPDYPIEFLEVNHTIYPDIFLASYRNSNGFLEYSDDYTYKYKRLSSQGVSNVIHSLYNIDAKYNNLINVDTLDWIYKVSLANNDEYNKATDCVVYITSSSIVVNGYEYYIESGIEYTNHLLEIFEWYYEHEDFGNYVKK